MTSPDYYHYLLAAVSQDNVLPLTSRCNLGCIFCSHRQNPPGVTTYKLPPLPVETVTDLAQFLDGSKPVIIGESATRIDEGEPFTHPELFTILRNLRHMFPKVKLAITTNGTLLDTANVRELAELQPLELTVSLNSVTARGRQLLLRDAEPERAPLAVTLLGQSGIPFHGSLVAMPHLTGWDDIAETTRFLANQGALTVRIFLPGYTALAPDKLRFSLSLWDDVLAWAKARNAELGVPVLPEPALCRDITPEIYGIIRNSPAAVAGLKAGDQIQRINNRIIKSRVDAYQQAQLADNPTIHLTRDGEPITVVLTKKRRESPGFAVLYDFDPQRLRGLAVEITQAHSPLLLASLFAAPLIERLTGELGLPATSVVAVPNHYFGGSIQAAGLLTVSDLLTVAIKEVKKQPRDLILVPREAFDPQGLDLTGVSLQQLSHKLGIPARAV